MSFPRYSEYKDSGVGWLGEVPAHWELSKIKHLARFAGGGTPSRDNPRYWGGSIPWVSPKDMKVARIEAAEEYITEEGLEGSSTGLIPPGRVLMVVRSGILKHSIPVAINAVEVALNQDMKALDFSDGACCAAFFFRWVEGLNDLLLLEWAKQGATVESIEHAYLAETLLPLPSAPEQAAIAAFLDRETAKIDALVAEQQNLIALLKEKRQALISHAVTKGLDPDVPMKDSGVAWLGEVPAHWTVAPIKYFVKFRSGGTPSKDRVDYWDGELPWASAKDLKTEELLDTADHISETAIDDGAANLLDAGTVLIVVRGMILARTFPVALTGSRMAINQDLKGLEPNPKMSPEFLAWYLRGTAAESLSRLDEAGHGTKALRMEAWASLEVSLPPLDEQVAIAEAVDYETARIDELSVEADLTIALLLERRTALISAAVTGKIDVRHLVAASVEPLPEPA